MFWGLTPSLDLLVEFSTFKQSVPDEVNILLVGSADARHILKTLARRYRNGPNIRVNFFIVEASVETIAKQLLLLNVAFQDESVFGLVAKTKIFMELYGNSLVRPSVAKFLTSTATELVKMVTDYQHLQKFMPFISLDIKYKERDYLENLLKFWSSQDEFNICQSWDHRLRQNLGARYDSKLGAFDWDLHMRLHSVGGTQVCNQEYRDFRATGVAFKWLESEVSKPNRSMACVVVPNGDKFIHYGYLGDMQTGPFIAYGLECDDSNFLKSVNGQNSYRATDVTERNLNQIFYEIQFENEYQHREISDLKLGPVVMQSGERMVVDFKNNEVIPLRKGNKCFSIKNCDIKFISVSMLPMMVHKEKYKQFFNLVYFSSFYLKYLTRELLEHICAKNSPIIVENQKFILSYREKQLKEHCEKVKQAVDGTGVEELPFDPCTDNYLKFLKV